MFKNALVYRIENDFDPELGDLESRLAELPFVECAPSQPESSGFVPPRGDRHAALAESVGGQIVLKLCTETKAVPGGVVKTQIQRELDQIEQETGRRPKGKRVKEIKEAVVHKLLPRAFPKRSETLVWIDRDAKLVWVGASSMKKADGVITKLVERLGGDFRLAPMQTALSPATAMATWLVEKEAPAGFSVDRDCELKQPDSEKASVRYARHALDTDEPGEHIRAGKLPTQLAMTWAGRVSFVLTESLTLKKVQLLDVVLEGAGVDAAQGGRTAADFDADIAIATGELRQLLPALVDALGGWQAPGAAPTGPAAADGAGDGAADGGKAAPSPSASATSQPSRPASPSPAPAGDDSPPWDVAA